MGNRPPIGLLLDYQSDGSFSTRPHYALRTVYFEAIWKAGGLPVAIPYVSEAASDYLDLCRGFIFPGGFYPFPSRYYGDDLGPGEKLHPRFEFEERFMEAVLLRNKPVLGICAGMQVLAGCYGGLFFNDLKSMVDTDIDHLNEKPAENPAHAISVTEGTMLAELLDTTEFRVNTAHNEALKNEPEGLVINAVAEDGVIEGIEDPEKLFCLGVQWHPEFFADYGDPNFSLFTGLVKAANQESG